MPRDEVDVSNIVSSKHVPHVALRLLDPLNGADAANAARLSTTTEQPPSAIDQGQTATWGPLPELALSLKRQVHTNEIEGDHGKQLPGLCLYWLFTRFSAAKRACSTVSTSSTTTPRSCYSPAVEDVENEDRPTSAPGTWD
jgi:hypothetical protein